MPTGVKWIPRFRNSAIAELRNCENVLLLEGGILWFDPSGVLETVEVTVGPEPRRQEEDMGVPWREQLPEEDVGVLEPGDWDFVERAVAARRRDPYRPPG